MVLLNMHSIHQGLQDILVLLNPSFTFQSSPLNVLFISHLFQLICQSKSTSLVSTYNLPGFDRPPTLLPQILHVKPWAISRYRSRGQGRTPGAKQRWGQGFAAKLNSVQDLHTNIKGLSILHKLWATNWTLTCEFCPELLYQALLLTLDFKTKVIHTAKQIVLTETNFPFQCKVLRMLRWNVWIGRGTRISVYTAILNLIHCKVMCVYTRKQLHNYLHIQEADRHTCCQ